MSILSLPGGKASLYANCGILHPEVVPKMSLPLSLLCILKLTLAKVESRTIIPLWGGRAPVLTAQGTSTEYHYDESGIGPSLSLEYLVLN